MYRRIKSILGFFLENAIFFLEKIAPKKKEVLCFSMAKCLYNGNSKALFEFIIKSNNSSLKAFWLYDKGFDKNSVDPAFHRFLLKKYSLRGLFTFLRSGVICLSHGFGDFGYYTKAAKSKFVVQLWHGIGIKAMGLLDEKFDESLKNRYVKSEARYYDLLITSSDIDRFYTSAYTGVDVRKVAETGLPRNDRLFRLKQAAPKRKIKILYAPTFRDFEYPEESLFFPFRLKQNEIVYWAQDNSFEFYLRPHPNDNKSLSVLDKLCSQYPDTFIDASANAYNDTTDVLEKVHGVITDYSSVFIDSLILDLPCVFVDYDRSLYERRRGFAYDYELVTPGPKVNDWISFKEGCYQAFRKDSYRDQRNAVKRMFFKHWDDNACERITQLIELRVS